MNTLKLYSWVIIYHQRTLKELVDYLSDKDFSVNVISKSGTTTEPAVAFRLFKQLVEDKYGKAEAKNVSLLLQIKQKVH